jgi:hypothetical protein
MALGKTLGKSNALRAHSTLDELVRSANAEISRDNPGMMFITALFGILDIRNGLLQFCNAGHDPPLVVGGSEPRRVTGPGGPPLCVMDGLPYPMNELTLAPGETITEAGVNMRIWRPERFANWPEVTANVPLRSLARNSPSWVVGLKLKRL